MLFFHDPQGLNDIDIKLDSFEMGARNKSIEPSVRLQIVRVLLDVSKEQCETHLPCGEVHNDGADMLYTVVAKRSSSKQN